METNQQTSNLNPQATSPRFTNAPLSTQADHNSQPSIPKKKFPKWLIVVLIISLFGTASTFTYKYYQLKQRVESQVTPSPLPTVALSNSLQASDLTEN